MVGGYMTMKLCNKIIFVLGAAACVGLVYSAAGLANDEAADDSIVGVTGSYGSTMTVIKRAQAPMFSHRVHVTGVGLDCDSCHPDTFQKKRGAAEAAGDFTMKSLEEGKYCGMCHDGDTAFGVTGPETCVTCHGSNMQQPKTIIFEEPVKAVTFNHTAHTEDMGFDCNDCHNDIFKMKMGNAELHPDQFTMEALYAGKYCGACHDGETAFASDTKCASCHIGVIGFDRLFGEETPEGEGHGE
jgi:c(7)-type cytochrome triheme protein